MALLTMHEEINNFIISLESLQTLDWKHIESTMRKIYSDDLIFIDPIFKRQGLDDVLKLYHRMVRSAKAIQIEIIAINTHSDEFNLQLNLEFIHKLGFKFKIKQAIIHVKFFNNKVVTRRDIWKIRNVRLSWDRRV